MMCNLPSVLDMPGILAEVVIYWPQKSLIRQNEILSCRGEVVASRADVCLYICGNSYTPAYMFLRCGCSIRAEFSLIVSNHNFSHTTFQQSI